MSVWILENRENIKSDDVCGLLMTFAVLGYIPTNFNDIFEQLITPIIQSKSLTTFELLDMVWALTVLEKASAEHAEMILNYDFLNNDHLCAQPSKIIKILNINAAASVSIPNYTGPILPENSLFFKPDIILSKERIKISNPIIKALKLLLPANNTYMNSYNNTNMGFIIDAEFCVDNNCTPFPINLTLSEEINRVAVLSVTFSEMCYELTEVMGKIKFYSKLLEKKGYKVLLLPYKEEQSKQPLISRAKFINEKLKQLLEK
ncbi:PREDICTED: protein TBRG4 [Ceratosolen solmsi marchali]|uniref:Protein TBRG4 n=1 Tax=Ceratosolen solmsi marchali TaxID=326594 RepID=A0AAJ6YUD2_9HYME|nr:PREDICTED: protein TBRG4 [Ceratosolen solmsi marchali]